MCVFVFVSVSCFSSCMSYIIVQEPEAANSCKGTDVAEEGAEEEAEGKDSRMEEEKAGHKCLQWNYHKIKSQKLRMSLKMRKCRCQIWPCLSSSLLNLQVRQRLSFLSLQVRQRPSS